MRQKPLSTLFSKKNKKKARRSACSYNFCLIIAENFGTLTNTMIKAKTNKKRSVVSFTNLPVELQEEVKKLYPYGYTEAMMRIDKPNGEFFYAVPFETEEVSYLVKINVKIDDHIEEEDDKDYYNDDLKGADELADNEEDEDIDNLRDEI